MEIGITETLCARTSHKVRMHELRRPTVPRPLGSGTNVGSVGAVGSVERAVVVSAQKWATEMKVMMGTMEDILVGACSSGGEDN